MPTKIQTSLKLPFYTEQVNLDDETFTLEFKWNNRDSFWYLSVYDESNSPIIYSSRLVVNFPIMRRVANSARPLGGLYVAELSGTDAEAAFDELGTRVVLVYFSEDEIEEMV